MVKTLTRVLRAASLDSGIRVVVLGHAGTAFCSGADLREQIRRRPRESRLSGLSALADLFNLILNSPKPVVCEVSGAVRAAGIGLVAACDIALGTTSATFAASEVLVGVAPALIGAVVVPKIGRASAARFFLTGRTIGGVEAHRIGLLAEVVPDGSLEHASDVLVAELLRANPTSLSVAKQILRDIPLMRQDEGLLQMAQLSARLFSSAEGAEGMSAVLERRPPSWVPIEPALRVGSKTSRSRGRVT